MLITQEGYYFGVITSSGFGTSSGGFPQEVLGVQAQQVFDQESGEYVPIDPEGGADGTWYGVLIDSNDKETRNSQQLSKVTGWSGASFVELQKADYSGMPIQFRVETNLYNGKTSLKITWIDEEGAAPFKSVPKCSLEEAQALQARYAGVLAGNKAPVTAASAPGTATTPATVVPPQEKSKRKRRTKAEIEADKAAAEAAAVANTSPPDTTVDTQQPTTAPATRPTAPATRPPQTQEAAGTCTIEEAWDAVSAARRDDITDPQLADAWLSAIQLYAPDGKEESATDETWFVVRQKVLAATGKV